MAEAANTPDDSDVPAAVFCLRCGRADCAGCPPVESAAGATPWEARELPLFRRLWETARLSTVNGETFFGTFGEGNVGAAFGFALTCELLAIGSLACLWLPFLYALSPGLVESLLADPARRHVVVSVSVLSVPALALVMVGLHVLWASGLELGIRVTGAKGRASHCLRYALYSCGWDLITSPFGFAAGCAAHGIRRATAELGAAIRIPRFATMAYMTGARGLGERQRRTALRVAVALTGSIVLGGALAFGVALVAWMT